MNRPEPQDRPQTDRVSDRSRPGTPAERANQRQLSLGRHAIRRLPRRRRNARRRAPPLRSARSRHPGTGRVAPRDNCEPLARFLESASLSEFPGTQRRSTMQARTILVVGLLLGFASPTALWAQKVKTDFDPAVDFAKFTTYYWAKSDPSANDLMNQRLILAVDHWLTIKGWTRAAQETGAARRGAGLHNLRTEVDQYVLRQYGWRLGVRRMGRYGRNGDGIVDDDREHIRRGHVDPSICSMLRRRSSSGEPLRPTPCRTLPQRMLKRSRKPQRRCSRRNFRQQPRKRADDVTEPLLQEIRDESVARPDLSACCCRFPELPPPRT